MIPECSGPEVLTLIFATEGKSDMDEHHEYGILKE
jgi:hypothetical protein